MKKKTVTALTSVAVAGVAAGTLMNALELEDLFQPQSFEKFENRHRSEEYDYIAGNGADIDLADEEQDGSDRDGGEVQQVLQVAKETEEQQTEAKPGGSTLGIADPTPKEKQETESENRNAVIFTDDTPEPAGKKDPPAKTDQPETKPDSATDTPVRPSGDGSGKDDAGKTPEHSGNESGNGTGDNTDAGKDPSGDGSHDDGGNQSGTPSGGNTSESDPTGDHGKDDRPSGGNGSETKPSVPKPVLTDKEKEQLTPFDPVETTDGTLLGISAVFKRDHYTRGEQFSPDDAEVTATWLKNGSTVTKKLSYGGADGYTVSLPTSEVGTRTAVFSYRGSSIRVRFRVLSSYVDIRYHAFYNQEYYQSPFPGAPMEALAGSAYEELRELASSSNNYAGRGDVIDLTDVHRRMIAYLGDARVRQAFREAPAGENYQSVVFLDTAEDGYLSTMLTGFCWMLNKALQESGTYVYYPAEEWSATRTVIDLVAAVPDGYKVRRVTENEGDFASYHGDQVLEQYTGGGDTIETPRGVTRVSFTKAAQQVQTLKLPNSVQEIDTESVAKYLPGLQSYAYTDPDESHVCLSYQIIDGILYSADGKTLLSVPAGRKQVTVPESVTKLAEGCFAGMSEDSVVTFSRAEAPQLAGETGFRGTIRVPDSDYDQIVKAYMFAFGEECASITFATEEVSTGRYGYDGTAPLLYERRERETLAGIPQNTVGNYKVPESIRAIGEGAFAGCTRLTDIELPKTVTTLQKDSLVLPASVGTVTLAAAYTEVSPEVFGDPKQGAAVPSISIFVPEESYADYLEKWTEILDPVYGTGTAKHLLAVTDGTVFFEDGAKYETVHYGEEVGYRLLNVYQKDETAIRVKNGTREIAASAFSSCDALEVLYLPESLEALTAGQLQDCTALRMVISDSGRFTAAEAGLSDMAEVFRAGGEYAAFSCEDGIVYGISKTGEKTLLCVPTDYTGVLQAETNVGCIYRNSMKGCTRLTGLTFPDAVLTKLEDGCFSGCTALTGLDFGAQAGLVSIGADAFSGCTALQTLTLPETVTVLPEGVCRSCTSLKKISASGTRQIGAEAFSGCSLLAELDCLQKVEQLGDRSFAGCQSLTELVLPETLTEIGEGCFENCTAVTDVTLNGALTVISRYCFAGCRELRRLSFGEQQRQQLRVIGACAFEACSSLENLDLDDLDSLTYLGAQAFVNCTGLVRIRLPKTLQMLSDGCFYGCTSLSMVRLYSDSVMELGESVFGSTCDPFIRVQVPGEEREAYLAAWKQVLDTEYGDGTAGRMLGVLDETHEEIRGVLFELTDAGRILKKASPELTGEYIVPDDTIRIEDDAFAGCTGLTAVGITKDTTLSLGARCFKGCTGLETLVLYGDITDWDEETFMDCTGLTRIIIGNNADTKTSRIGVRAFKNCTGLATAGAVSIRCMIQVYDTECFSGCSNLQAFSYLTAARAAVVEIGDYAFYGCRSMTAFLTTAYSSVQRIGNYAFSECDTLRQPSIPASVKTIGEGCFMGCDNLQYVSFYGAVEEYPKDCFRDCPKLIRTGGKAEAFAGLKRIGENAYAGCKSLDSSTASWSLSRYSALEEIGDGAFSGCTKLSDNTLSATVKRIGDGAFSGCTNLKVLTLRSETPPEIGALDLASMADGFQIRVPDSKAQEDAVYRAYRKVLEALLGKEKAYEILDSVSDGARERVKEEEESESESESERESESESESEPERESESESESGTGDGTEAGAGSTESAGTEAAVPESKVTEGENGVAAAPEAEGKNEERQSQTDSPETDSNRQETTPGDEYQTEAANPPQTAEQLQTMTETLPETGSWQTAEQPLQTETKEPQEATEEVREYHDN